MRRIEPKQPPTIRFKHIFPSYSFWTNTMEEIGTPTTEQIYNRIYAQFNNIQLKWSDFEEARFNCGLAYENAYNKYLIYKQIWNEYNNIEDLLNTASDNTATQYRGDNKKEGQENQVNMVAQKIGNKSKARASIAQSYPTLIGFLEQSVPPLQFLARQFILQVQLIYQEHTKEYYRSEGDQ